MRRANKKKRTKKVYWVCDKRDCNTGNTRYIPVNSVLNDDICDFCHRRIHEPVLIDLKDDEK